MRAVAEPRLRETAPSEDGALTLLKVLAGGEKVQIAPRESDDEKEALDPSAKEVLVNPWELLNLASTFEGKTNVDKRPSLDTSGFSVHILPELFLIGMTGGGIDQRDALPAPRDTKITAEAQGRCGKFVAAVCEKVSLGLLEGSEADRTYREANKRQQCSCKTALS